MINEKKNIRMNKMNKRLSKQADTFFRRLLRKIMIDAWVFSNN